MIGIAFSLLLACIACVVVVWPLLFVERCAIPAPRTTPREEARARLLEAMSELALACESGRLSAEDGEAERIRLEQAYLALEHAPAAKQQLAHAETQPFGD